VRFLRLLIMAIVTQVFSSSGTWTVPVGVYSVNVECWGAGGGGGQSALNNGGGGGGGYALLNAFSVTPGGTLSVTVGVGGAAGSAGAGGTGGASSCAGISGTGGGGGSSAGGGAGGSFSGPISATFAGGNGFGTGANGGGGGGGAGDQGNGSSATSNIGGAGGPITGGNGGNGGHNSNPLSAGFPGSLVGGGGGGSRSGTGSFTGAGAGANGQVRLTWTVYVPLEAKVHKALGLDPKLPTLVPQGFFDLQLPQGLINASSATPLTAMTVQRISTDQPSLHSAASGNAQGVIIPLTRVRLQFTVWAVGPESHMQAHLVLDALVNFLNANSWNGGVGFANLVVSRRVALYQPTQPPIYTGILDARIYNREDL